MFSANSSQVSDDKLFVEDVFSTWLYTGNGASQTITNGIDLAGKGGMVWIKDRSAASSQRLYDTTRGANNAVFSNLTNAQTTVADSLTAFNSNGFTAGSANGTNGNNYASWTFREAPKFFDIVTYTGNGSVRTIAHNLGVAPGMVIVKRTDGGNSWAVWHRGAPTGYLILNATDAVNTGVAAANIFGNGSSVIPPTSTEFTVGPGWFETNGSGATYVAYLYAHDATSDGVIQCGSFTTDGNVVPNVTLGWEPQWVMVKRTDSTGNWYMFDAMRGMPAGPTGYSRTLYANTSGSETLNVLLAPNATGFSSPYFDAANASYVYVAIRRGPMKTPTLGTSVFSPYAATASVDTAITTSFPVDLMLSSNTASNDSTNNHTFVDRLRGAIAVTNTEGSRNFSLNSTVTSAETSLTYPTAYNWGNTSVTQGYGLNGAAVSYNFFRRAPGFFDEVCYTGNGVDGRTINHNLGVTPELMIMKNRSSAGYNWFTWDKSADLSQAYALLALSNAAGRPAFSSGNLNSTVPTSTVFTIGGDSNASGNNYVTYLFASCPGVSKVGSYTGNGSSQTINCAFTTGARFVMIKRTDSTGNWYVWNTATGIVAANDPYQALNDVSAQNFNGAADSVDTASSGFVVNQVAATNVNVNAATYIYLAIA